MRRVTLTDIARFRMLRPTPAYIGPMMACEHLWNWWHHG